MGADGGHSGPGGASTPAEARVTVGLPAAPVVKSAVLATAFDTPSSVKLLATGVFNHFVIVDPPVSGRATIEGDLLRFVPHGGFYGADTMTYAAEGPGGRSVVGQIALSVGLPGAPALNGGALAVDFGKAATFTLQPSGVIGDYQVTANPAHGTVAIAGNVVTYSPQLGYSGFDTFSIKAVGPGGDSDEAKFVVEVKAAPVVSPPVLVVPSPVLEVEAEASGVTQIVSQGEVDDILVVERPKHGVVEVVRVPAMAGPAMLLLASAPETLAVTYKPEKGFQGRDAFKIAAKGPGGVSDPVQVKVSVGVVPPIALPEAQPDAAETVVGKSVRIDVGSNDKNVKSVRVDLEPANGTATVEGTSIIYSPSAGFSGRDELRYVAVNDDGESASASVSILVKKGAVPVTSAHAVSAWAGKTVMVDLSEGAIGGPFTGAFVLGLSDSSAGGASIVSEGARILLKFVPAANFAGRLVVRYALENQFGRSDPGEVAITINARPDPSKGGDMPGLLAGASEAAGRFSSTQTVNVSRRMETLHGGAQPRANLGVSLPIDNGERAPGRDPSREAIRAALIEATRPERSKVQDERFDQLQAPEIGLWAGGAFDFGHRTSAKATARREFETSGLTVGLDRRLNPAVAVGVALGFGHDRSEVGSSGSKLAADQLSGMGYATMQLADRAFIDVVGGYGRLRYKTARVAAETGAAIEGRQRGSAVFGATSLGWDFNRQTVGFSPYGRVQYLRAELSAYSETGDDTFALRVGRRQVEDLSLVAGTRAWLVKPFRRGTLRPQIRAEYRQTVKGAGSAQLQYADWLDGPVYGVEARAVENTSADIGLGLNWRSVDGATAEVEYQTDLLAEGQAGRLTLRFATAF